MPTYHHLSPAQTAAAIGLPGHAAAMLLTSAVWVGLALLVLSGAADTAPALSLASLPAAA